MLKEKAGSIKEDLLKEITDQNGASFLAKKVDLDASGLKDLCFELGTKVANGFFVLGSNHEGKALLACYIDKQLVSDKGLDAGKIVRELGKHIKVVEVDSHFLPPLGVKTLTELWQR